ncbi:MAG: ABC transporter permease [Bacteroidales bacterium]
MFFHHLKLSFRNLLRRWLISGINILGLGFGISCTIVIFLFVQHELSYNQYHEHSGRIYRIVNKYSIRDEGLNYSPYQPDELSEGIKQDLPFVEKATSFRRTSIWVSDGNRKFRLDVGFVNPDFLEIFTHVPLAGNLENALEKPQTVVLCRREADRIFPGMAGNYEDMIGQTLEFPQQPPNQFMVTAVIADPPENSSIRFTALTHFDNRESYPRSNDAFGANSVYILLKEGTDQAAAEQAVRSLIGKYQGKTLESLAEYMSLKEGEYSFTWELQPLKDIYLDSAHIRFSYERRGNAQVLYFLSLIAAFILFIACFNYIMLTIGHSMDRMKELAVMKIVGARRIDIVRLFWAESFLMSVIALFLGIFLAEQLLPLFNRFAQKTLTFTLYRNWSSYLFLFMMILLIVFSTSSYIARFLFRQNNPLSVLRKENPLIRRNRFSRVFIFLQYFISVGLLVCTLVIVRQLYYLKNKDVGFDRENIVVLNVDFPLSKIQALKTRLLDNPAVEKVSMSDRNFVSGSSAFTLKTGSGEIVRTRILRVDEDYVATLGLELREGKNFREMAPEDTVPVVLVNETLVKTFGLEEPVGALLFFDPINRHVQITGVVKDFHYDSLKDPVEPLILAPFPFNAIWTVFVRVHPVQKQAALEHIQKAWKEVVPEFPYEYAFLDDMLDGQYVNEDRWATVTATSAAIALFLTALGLLGLTGLLVSRRIKEIGVRKVNGADTVQILYLLNTDFLKWVLIATLAAIPASWYIMHRWLENFEARISLSWIYFALAGLAAILIALITVTLRSWTYASKNPADTLRYE